MTIDPSNRKTDSNQEWLMKMIDNKTDMLFFSRRSTRRKNWSDSLTSDAGVFFASSLEIESSKEWEESSTSVITGQTLEVEGEKRIVSAKTRHRNQSDSHRCLLLTVCDISVEIKVDDYQLQSIGRHVRCRVCPCVCVRTLKNNQVEESFE